MRDSLPGFYRPSDLELDKLWREGTIVLDANVLLNAYRLPKQASDEFLSVLEKIKDRLWIPYQFALEFQRNRILVIAGQRAKIESALAQVKKQLAASEEALKGLEIEKSGLGINPTELLKELSEASEKIQKALIEVQKTHPGIGSSDPIRARMDDFLGGRVGPGPVDRAALDALIVDCDDRYNSKIPPGFADEGKDDHPEGASFVHAGLEYQRKHGDLIAWRQTLSHASAESVRGILFVTSDVKSDWWWREKNRTIGPHPELICEAQRIAGVDAFWMYPFDQFLERSVDYLNTIVSKSSIEEAQHVTEAATTKPTISEAFLRSGFKAARNRIDFEDIETSVGTAITNHLRFKNPNLNYIDALGDLQYLFRDDQFMIAKAIFPKHDMLSSPEKFLEALEQVMRFLNGNPPKRYAIYLLSSRESFRKANQDPDFFRFVEDAVEKRLRPNENLYVFVGTIIGNEFAPYYNP